MAAITRDLYNVSIVRSSFVRRLRDDILYRPHKSFDLNFGFEEVLVSYVCRGGRRVRDIEYKSDEVVDQWPDIIFIQCGGNDLLGSLRCPLFYRFCAFFSPGMKQSGLAQTSSLCTVMDILFVL